MLDAFLGHYAYWGAIVLLGVGLYAVTASGNLVKKVMGLSVFQTAVFVLYISIGAVEGATAPIAGPSWAAYANPLPHVLILTAIVVGVATAALALALVVRIHAAWGSVEEDVIARAEAEPAEPPAWAALAPGDGRDGEGGGSRESGSRTGAGPARTFPGTLPPRGNAPERRARTRRRPDGGRGSVSTHPEAEGRTEAGNR